MKNKYFSFHFFLDILFPLTGSERLARHLTVEYLPLHCAHSNASPFPDALAPFAYRSPALKQGLRLLKYKKAKHFAHLFGSALAPYVLDEISERAMYGSFLSPVVVPIPLSKTKRRVRGYNQAELIAQSLVAALESKPRFEPAALLRVKETPSQTLQGGRNARERNLRDAFTVANPALVANRDIILVDDIVTTGATLRSARATLLSAGARRVLCVAVAQ